MFLPPELPYSSSCQDFSRSSSINISLSSCGIGNYGSRFIPLPPPPIKGHFLAWNGPFQVVGGLWPVNLRVILPAITEVILNPTESA